jgi:putative transposase
MSVGRLGGSEAIFYLWKKKYSQLGVSELRRLRQVEDENRRLKQWMADLILDKHMLTEALRKKG